MIDPISISSDDEIDFINEDDERKDYELEEEDKVNALDQTHDHKNNEGNKNTQVIFSEQANNLYQGGCFDQKE